MKVESLQVQRFRNIREIDLPLDPSLNVISGQNGQGKTSLLEAVWMLTGAKSFRAARDIDLVMHGQETGRITGETLAFGRQEKIRIDLCGVSSPKKGRYASINGVDYGRAAAIAGRFTVVVFYPDHLRLVKGSPEGRRKFIDAALCQLYPGYVSILRRYNRALLQKNSLLKNYNQTADADQLLDAFDLQLAESGQEITQRRREFVLKCGIIAEKYYSEISEQREKLGLRFVAGCESDDYTGFFRASRRRDVKAGFCTVGPHREDIEVLVNEKSARVFASQGQQRSAVLALKLAEATHIKQVTKEYPVLLLDDVLSELDSGRKNYLLGHITGMQCFITSCERDICGGTNGREIQIQEGNLVQ